MISRRDKKDVTWAKKDGYVDIYITLNEGGFVEVARRLGIPTVIKQ